MKLIWLDARALAEEKEAILEEALHQRVDAVVAAELTDLETMPPTAKRVLFTPGTPLPEDLSAADVVILDPAADVEAAELAKRHPEVEFGRFVEIIDETTLKDACQAARTARWSVLRFRDPTKIPLEIVIARRPRRPAA